MVINGFRSEFLNAPKLCNSQISIFHYIGPIEPFYAVFLRSFIYNWFVSQGHKVCGSICTWKLPSHCRIEARCISRSLPLVVGLVGRMVEFSDGVQMRLNYRGWVVVRWDWRNFRIQLAALARRNEADLIFYWLFSFLFFSSCLTIHYIPLSNGQLCPLMKYPPLTWPRTWFIYLWEV